MPDATSPIKLQLLLSQQPGAGERAARWLEARGVRLTASGARTLSAEASPEVFRELFGTPPETSSGFTPRVAEAAPLPVPRELADEVELITPVPRHRRF